MQLKVNYPVLDEWGDTEVVSRTITSFRDIVSIGAALARCVRIWLRGVPLQREESRLTIQLHAGWVESEPATHPAPAGRAGGPVEKKRKAKK